MIARADCGEHLRQCDVVLQQLLRVDLSLVLLRSAPEGGDINDSGHLLELASYKPVLRGLDLVQAVTLALQLIAVNLADCRPGRELRFQALGQRDGLQAIQNFLTISEVIGIEVEVQLDITQSEKADGTHILQSRNPVQDGFNWHRDLLLHLLSRPRGILRDHIDERRRGIGICLDVETHERPDSGR